MPNYSSANFQSSIYSSLGLETDKIAYDDGDDDNIDDIIGKENNDDDDQDGNDNDSDAENDDDDDDDHDYDVFMMYL